MGGRAVYERGADVRARGHRGRARGGSGDSRELAGEFSNDESSEETVLLVVLAFEARRAWKGCSGMASGESRSGSEDASDMATSESSLEGNAKRFGRFASCVQCTEGRGNG